MKTNCIRTDVAEYIANCERFKELELAVFDETYVDSSELGPNGAVTIHTYALGICDLLDLNQAEINKNGEINGYRKGS